MKQFMLILVLVFVLFTSSVQAAPPDNPPPKITLSCYTDCYTYQRVYIDGTGFDPKMRFGIRHGDSAGNEWSHGLWDYANDDGTIHAIIRFPTPGNYYMYAYQVKNTNSKKLFNQTEKVYFTVQ